MKPFHSWVFLCLLGVLASGVGVIYVKYSSRLLFIELQGLITQKEQLEIDFGRLQLEQSTLAVHWRVESTARIKLNMRLPLPVETVMMTP